eukprot:4643842-Amphidinium_carterae.1
MFQQFGDDVAFNNILCQCGVCGGVREAWSQEARERRDRLKEAQARQQEFMLQTSNSVYKPSTIGLCRLRQCLCCTMQHWLNCDADPGQQLLKENSSVQFRMVAEPRFTMREVSGATDDRETVEEDNEETREIDNECRMIDEKCVTSVDNED